jgi:8-oxo-dGTP pyrophosphatase MutT (NUDIX family)
MPQSADGLFLFGIDPSGGRASVMSHIHALLRCSVVVFSAATDGDRVLLVHRRDKDDWVLPGGTPRPGEDLLTCAGCELREETGLRIDPGTCALIIETVRPYSPRLIDLVFLSPTHPIAQTSGREDRLSPRFVPLEQVDALTLHPPVTRHLHELHSRRDRTVATEYVRQEWRSTTTPGPWDIRQMRQRGPGSP